MDNVPLSIMERFEILEDPRTGHARRHELLDIICVADNWVEIEEFGKAKEEWFRRFLKLPHGIPSHDTFGRVFSLLDPEQFSACFMDWVRSVSELAHGDVVAIDGKTLRRCHDRANGRGPLHMVSAWATEHRMVLGQTRTEAHSNEITAIPELLKVLKLKGCLVTDRRHGLPEEHRPSGGARGRGLPACGEGQPERVVREHQGPVRLPGSGRDGMAWLTATTSNWAKATAGWNAASAG